MLAGAGSRGGLPAGARADDAVPDDDGLLRDFAVCDLYRSLLPIWAEIRVQDVLEQE